MCIRDSLDPTSTHEVDYQRNHVEYVSTSGQEECLIKELMATGLVDVLSHFEIDGDVKSSGCMDVKLHGRYNMIPIL